MDVLKKMGISKMILYKKEFPLGKGVSFSDYMKILDQKNFSPYVLLINKLSRPKNYHIEIVITDLSGFWGYINVFFGATLFRECTVEHSTNKKFFTLQASIGMTNFLTGLFYIVASLSSSLWILFMAVSKEVLSSGDWLAIVFILFIGLGPVIIQYSREKQLLDRIGNIASGL